MIRAGKQAMECADPARGICAAFPMWVEVTNNRLPVWPPGIVEQVSGGRSQHEPGKVGFQSQ